MSDQKKFVSGEESLKDISSLSDRVENSSQYVAREESPSRPPKEILVDRYPPTTYRAPRSLSLRNMVNETAATWPSASVAEAPITINDWPSTKSSHSYRSESAVSQFSVLHTEEASDYSWLFDSNRCKTAELNSLLGWNCFWERSLQGVPVIVDQELRSSYRIGRSKSHGATLFNAEDTTWPSASISQQPITIYELYSRDLASDPSSSTVAESSGTWSAFEDSKKDESAAVFSSMDNTFFKMNVNQFFECHWEKSILNSDGPSRVLANSFNAIPSKSFPMIQSSLRTFSFTDLLRVEGELCTDWSRFKQAEEPFEMNVAERSGSREMYIGLPLKASSPKPESVFTQHTRGGTLPVMKVNQKSGMNEKKAVGSRDSYTPAAPNDHVALSGHGSPSTHINENPPASMSARVVAQHTPASDSPFSSDPFSSIDAFGWYAMGSRALAIQSVTHGCFSANNSVAQQTMSPSQRKTNISPEYDSLVLSSADLEGDSAKKMDAMQNSFKSL